MAATHDKFGRPIVVVTGMGVVTSLGAGKADNWKKLTAGESGIRTITRFPTDGLKTSIAGTVDFLKVEAEPFSSPDLSQKLAETAAEEAMAQSGIGAKGDFPGPLFLAVAPVEIEWPHRLELGRDTGTPDYTYDDLLRVSGGGKYQRFHRRFLFGSVSDYLARPISAPRARRFRSRRHAPPAPAPSSSASKPSAAAKPTPRCASRPTARSIWKT